MARNQTPAQLANLKKFTSDQDHDACVASGRKAGIASAEARRKKKRLQDAAKWLLQAKDIISDADIKEKIVELTGDPDATNAEALMLIALRKAAKGDVDAMRFVRDTGGEAPSNKVELAGDVDRPIATMDLRNMSEEDLMRLAEARADDPDDPAPDE